MPRYIARTPIKYLDEDGEERIIAPGKPVPDELVDNSLEDAGAVEVIHDDELFHADDGAGGSGRDGGKPLARMTKGELTARAAELEIEVPENATNPTIAKLIEDELARRVASGQQQ